MTNERTLVLGASTKPERYSYKAAKKLVEHGHEIVLLGRREGEVADTAIQTSFENIEDIDTVTMYLGADNQVGYYDDIIALKPRRIIFNPGSENEELAVLARKNEIEVEEACTLVLLSMGNY